MKNRPHPGVVLADGIGPDGMGWTVTEAALKFGMARPSLSKVLNGHAAISTKFALTLESRGFGTAELWLRMQMLYELDQARSQSPVKIA